MPQIHAILKHWHPMIGWDFHIPWVPGTPAPAPSPVMYKTGATLAWVAAAVGLNGVTKMAMSHTSQGIGYTMLQDTDIGTMIPHIGPPSLLLPLDILFSASKSYFFTTQYKAEGANVAVALAVILNPNLNCGTPIPTPTGMVIALNTHFASMSFAEFMAALNRMAIEFLVQAALNFILGKFGDMVLSRMTFILRYYTASLVPKMLSKGAAKALLRRMGGVANREINDAARRLVAERAAGIARWFGRTDLAANPIVSGIVNGGIGYGAGGPMGFDNGAMGGPTVYGSTAEPAVKAVDGYLTNPAVEDHPATPPASTPTPAPTSTPAPAPAPAPTTTPTPAPTPTPTPTAPAGGNYDDGAGVCEPGDGT
jgi:hypothetical protein